MLWPTAPVWAQTTNSATSTAGKKLVWVLLRGALDSLHTVIPVADNNLRQHRPKLTDGWLPSALPLSSEFALHPSLKNLHSWYQSGQFSPIVAVGSGYDSRSHFDGQDFLESGLGQIDHDSGWLARAINSRHAQGLAIAQTTPIAFRSAEQVMEWFPSRFRLSKEDTYAALMDMYEETPSMLTSLQEGLAARDLLALDQAKENKKATFKSLAAACGTLMTSDNGPDCAMLELGGWDTHNNQVNRLNRQLTELDQGLAALKESLGDEWRNTVVVVSTEFGRTVRENGTAGTDHGTASCMLVAGGAMKGGSVLGAWPGLEEQQLFQGRDLMPTSSAFRWWATILAQHWGLTESQLQTVLPGSPRYEVNLMRQS
ncbi:DUF1501 domain-containing protein [Neiella sp. HB171785]|uniref:DUF1501 domain-containing protein n=2 Tax=Neiella litorisoli TaxID=2771431 RepID=A0A8J6QPT2_9GAMM|nr:DUF1501 domain-containing protein [Neiella litorisoli]MBD1388866.1 DUF1501 domain-containing protein [Neiella litorisoli]